MRMFEQSKWIGWEKEAPVGNTAPASNYLAKSFVIRNKPTQAFLYFCALGDGTLFLNGKTIPDLIRPTFPACFSKSIVYRTKDVTSLLQHGRNRLGIILGNYRINHELYDFSTPLSFIMELRVEYEDGSCETICSDESFQTAPSPLIFSATCCGERQDARLEIPGWCDANFDGSLWKKAIENHPPVGKFRTVKYPPKRILEEIPCKEIAPHLFDCGKTTAGYARAKISGKAGKLIKLNYSERLLPNGEHVDRSAYVKWNYPDMYNSDEYILDGTPEKIFNQYMGFHGFRYVEVVGEYDSIELTAVVEHTDIKPTASFHCDCEIINRIHEACVNSVLTCCQDVFVDNPKRDAPWIGDTMLSSEVIVSEFDSKELLLETARLCHDYQRPNGELPYDVPGVEGQYQKRFSGPDWGASVVFQIVWWLYRYTGDLKPFLEFQKDLEKTMTFFASIADADGYIGDPDYATGDWSSLHRCVRGRNDIMSNVYYCWDAEIMAELSERCGLERKTYDDLAEKIKLAFRNRYMPQGKFEEVSVSELIVLAARGFFEKKEMPEIIERIQKRIWEDDNLITFGVHGIKMLWELLAEHDCIQYLFDLVTNANGLGYAKNAKDGLTALTERFDYSGYDFAGIFSMNHHFFCMVDTFFYRRLAGIMVNDVARGDVVIAPAFIEGIHRLEAEFCGIHVSYDEKILYVQSPFMFTLEDKNGKKKYPAGTYTFSR